MDILLALCLGTATGAVIALKSRFKLRLGTALICGTEFAVTVGRFGLNWRCLHIWILTTLLMIAALSDIKSMEINDKLHIAAVVAFFLFLPFESSPLLILSRGIFGAITVGGGMTLLSLWADRSLGRETMGGGDIKLFAVLGLHLGAFTGIIAVFLSCLIGLIFCAVKHIPKGEPFPFAPSIALGAFIAVTVGTDAVNLYMNALFAKR